MMPAISIQALSKKYRRNSRPSYVALRDVLSYSVKNIFRKNTESMEEFWALEDIHLDVAAGDRVGIIGHNGAGKSTLLKIISRITPPTKGRIVLNGRVASLLEVGTGFHPELTGRENIYLNGSILGMHKTEINSKLDEIISFSGVEKFIDSPLKNYSSGMQLRLAFSVAAHLEPEILLIDEVLAVGDLEFQKKCIGKMEEVSRNEGRTILFVSHNMAVIRQLCNQGVVLEKGMVRYKGAINDAVAHYTNNLTFQVKRSEYAVFDLRGHPNKTQEEGLLEARIKVNNTLSEQFTPGNTLAIELGYFLKTPLIDPDIGIVIKNDQHQPLIGLNNKHTGQKLQLKVEEPAQAKIILPQLNIFRPGVYKIDLYFGDQYRFYECLYDALELMVTADDVYQSGHPMDPVWNQIFVPELTIEAGPA